MRVALFIPVVLALLAACSPEKKERNQSTLFATISPKQSGISFRNDLQITEDFDVFRYRNFYNGGGVGIGDINNDGLPDVYLTSNMGDNKLFLNKGNWKFEDITDKAGVAGTKIWSTGVAMADVNADGLLDIYVCNSGDIHGGRRENELFINNGDLTFTDRAAEYGLDDRGFSTHAVFFDYDKDGDLDCYVLNNSFRPISTLGYRNLREQRDEEGGDKLYNNNNGRFVDVSVPANIFGSVIGFGLGVTVGDVNQDNWPDIYVSNDFYERDYLYINNQDGTFSEKLTDFMGHLSMFSMGADLADVNNDGYPDIFSTDMLPEDNYRLKTISDFETYDVYQLRLRNGYYHQFMRNMLQLNNQDGTFREIGQLAGVDATDWSWGGLMADFDNDANKEIFVCNGIYKDVTDQDFVNFLGSSENMHKAIDGKKIDFKEFIDKMGSKKLSNYMFVNQGNLQFKNAADEWGLGAPSFSNGAAYGDLDNDGDLDLVVNNVNQDIFLYKNRSDSLRKNNFLAMSFKGLAKNSFGIGAKVSIYTAGTTIYQENVPMRGFQSSMDYKMTIGVGKVAKIDSIVVTWPSGNSQLMKDVPADQHLVLKESNANRQPLKISTKNQVALLTPVDMGRVIHRENTFNDFDQDRLLYQMLSTLGPAFASADVDGDGFDDFFLGGAAGKPDALYLQKGSTYVKVDSHFFDADSVSESVDAAFFDADGDKDLDLFVVTGGSEFNQQSTDLADRLYLNVGRKNGTPTYVSAQGNVPPIYQSGSCVRPSDIDHDGDIDLFVGTRVVPRYYGMPCDQLILINDGNGKFTDGTLQSAPALRQLGMVTDARWFDYDGNGFDDLILVGEWMPVMVFKNDGKKLEPVEVPGLARTNGWWNRITPGDIDGDGDVDFVLGNLGLNSKFRPSVSSPVSLYVNDFDQNGSIEPIFTFRKDQIDYPFALRQDVVKQMSSLKKKFIYFKDYAGKSLKDFMDPRVLAKARVLEFYEPRTLVLRNNGTEGFEILPLPVQAEFSPVFGIDLLDLNYDKKTDIVMGGNLFAVKPEAGKYDAMPGLVMTGDGRGNFAALNTRESGVKLEGEVRHIANLKTRVGNVIIFVRNNDESRFYKLRKE